MSLELMYITNSPEVALIAEKNGVERIWVDLETLGKEERQKNLNSVKSNHTLLDVRRISKILAASKCMVRVNPWNVNSVFEIEEVILAGADRIMLPMWKSEKEVDEFLRTVNKRVSTTLLLETKEAVECFDKVLQHPFLDEVHIGLNDLHLSYGMTFMFELLSNGLVESLCEKMRCAGIKYGFGGIASIGEGLLLSENIIMEHYRLCSTRAILSRSFCNPEDYSDLREIEKVFTKNIKELRSFEKSLCDKSKEDFLINKKIVCEKVEEIVMEKQNVKSDNR